MKSLTINLDEIEIKPITNQADFERASALIDALIDADLIEDEATRNKALDILEAITILAIDYEKKHFPIEKLDPIESIKQRIEMLNLSQKEVAKYFGGENRVSEVLNRKRPLTLKMVKNLYHGLGIPAEVLLA
jgi:HTH-type transcriptional regulator/antitoxin HigA